MQYSLYGHHGRGDEETEEDVVGGGEEKKKRELLSKSLGLTFTLLLKDTTGCKSDAELLGKLSTP